MTISDIPGITTVVSPDGISFLSRVGCWAMNLKRKISSVEEAGISTRLNGSAQFTKTSSLL
jgi:hypothetical protein